jgi:hypothetical protein
MNRRKKILVLVASMAAFGVGFLSTLRSAPAQDRATATVMTASVYTGR